MFKKLATGEISDPIISVQQWDALHGRKFGHKTAAFNKLAGNTSKYLLSHVTIMASVQTEEEPYDYLIKPECSYLVNNNDDGWENEVLKLSYRSFVGAFNFLEHYQNSKAAKGHIIDSVLRKIQITPESFVYFVDLLVATDLAHEDLVSKIRNEKLRYLSMGCVTDLVICSYCGKKVVDSNDFCQHLQYNKGQFIPDEDGVPRRVAELCFPGHTNVVLANGLHVPISSIKEGDRVISHSGEPREVVKTYQRDYTGELVSLSVLGIPTTIASTPNHPYWVLTPKSNCECGCNKLLKAKKKQIFERREYSKSFLPGHNLPTNTPATFPQFAFKEAKDIKIGDLLALPIPQKELETTVTPEMAELMGWFLAEGSFIKYNGSKVGVQFTLIDTDEMGVANRLADLLQGEFPSDKLPKVYKYARAEGGEKLAVVYRCKEAADWLFQYSGEYADAKVMPEEVIYWPIKIQKSLLKAYVHGDGTVDSLARHSVVSISDSLITQMQIIAARCGLWTRRQVIYEGEAFDIHEVPEGRDSNNFLPLHTLHFSPSDYATEFFNMTSHERKISAKWRIHDGFLLYRVTNVSRVPFTGQVFNLEVEEDHSYLVEGIAVHNCGHKSLPNGGVKFIEASWVAVPAFPGASLRTIVADTWEGPKTTFTKDAELVSKAASHLVLPKPCAVSAELGRFKL